MKLNTLFTHGPLYMHTIKRQNRCGVDILVSTTISHSSIHSSSLIVRFFL